VRIPSCATIDEILLVHRQDVTNPRVAITDDDIMANLPYDEGCAKWFDHHLLTESNQRPPETFDGRYGLAPSAARMVYEYYLVAHPGIQRFERLLAETDRLDSAQLNLEDVLDPRDYILLGYTLFPQANISLRVHWGPSREHVAAAVGHSIFNRTSGTNVGELMSKFGGGGHRGAGTCLLRAATADAQIAEIIALMKKDG